MRGATSDGVEDEVEAAGEARVVVTSRAAPGCAPEGRVRASYRDNYDQLVEIKRRVDPENLFSINQNIQA